MKSEIQNQIRCAAGKCLRGLVLCGLIFMAHFAHGDDLQQVTGKVWGDLPRVAKEAYVVGVSNLIDAEYAYQTKIAKRKPSSDQTLIQRFYAGSDGSTVDSVVKAIDDWYARNPDKSEKAVLDVVWIVYVKKGN